MIKLLKNKVLISLILVLLIGMVGNIAYAAVTIKEVGGVKIYDTRNGYVKGTSGTFVIEATNTGVTSVDRMRWTITQMYGPNDDYSNDMGQIVTYFIESDGSGSSTMFGGGSLSYSNNVHTLTFTFTEEGRYVVKPYVYNNGWKYFGNSPDNDRYLVVTNSYKSGRSWTPEISVSNVTYGQTVNGVLSNYPGGTQWWGINQSSTTPPTDKGNLNTNHTRVGSSLNVYYNWNNWFQTEVSMPTTDVLVPGTYYLWAEDIVGNRTYKQFQVTGTGPTPTPTKAPNPITVSNGSMKTGATLDLANLVSNAQGTVTYTIKTNGTTTASTLSGSTLTAGAMSPTSDADQTVVVTAKAAGNGSYFEGSRDITITVSKNTRTLSFTAPTSTNLAYNSTATVTATASGSGGTAGTISYSSGTTSVITITGTTLKAVAASGSSVITATMARTTTVKQATKTITINAVKANLSVTATAYSGAYDGSSHSASVKVNSSGWDGKTIVSGTTTSYGNTVTSTGAVSTSYTLKPAYTNVTTAVTIYFKVTGGTNFNDYTGSTTVTISKANAVNPTLTDGGGVYNGSPYYIGSTGGSGGTIYYRTSSDNSTWGDWGTDKPYRTNVGVTYVQAYVYGDSNHNSTSATGSKKIQVTKANLSVTVTSYSGNYDGAEHGAKVKVTSAYWGGTGMSIVSGTTTSYGTTVVTNGAKNTEYTLSPKYTDNTSGAKTIYYKISGGTNYNDYTGTTTVTISPVEISVTWGSQTSFIYNGNPQAPSVTTPVNGVNGEKVNIGRTTQTNVGSYTSMASISSVTGGRAKKENYTLKNKTKNYTIEKQACVNPTVTDVTVTYDGAQHTIQVSNNASGGTVEYSTGGAGGGEGTWGSTLPTFSEVGIYTILVRVVPDSNHYAIAHTQGTLTINQATPTLTITLNPTTYVYDSQEKRPTATVKVGSKTLVNGTDYTVDYNNNVHAGTATAIITLQGNYSGTGTKTFTITKHDLTVKAPTHTIEYRSPMPTIVFTYEGAQGYDVPFLTGNYSCVYTNNSPVGSYPINVGTLDLGTNNSFRKSDYNMIFVPGQIIVSPISDLHVDIDPTTFTYDGTNHEPMETIYATRYQQYTLVRGTDYDVTYANNKHVGTGTATFAFKGNYSGSVTKEFNIVKRTIKVVPDNKTKVFGAPDPTLTYRWDNTLSGETPVTTGSITRDPGESIGVYSIRRGTLALGSNSSFSANDYDLAFEDGRTLTIGKDYIATVTLNPDTYIYDGNAKTPDTIVKNADGVVLQRGADKDYIVTYADNIEVGTAYAIITGRNNYSGYLRAPFTINPDNITGNVTIISETSDPSVGDMLSTNVTITHPSDSPVNLSYQWYMSDTQSTTGGIAINDATMNRLELTNEMIGKYIYVAVVASKINYNPATLLACTTYKIKEKEAPMAPIITAKLNNENGNTYNSGTWTNQNVWLSISSEDNDRISKYEYSITSPSSGFQAVTSMTNQIGYMLLTNNVNMVRYYFRSVDAYGNVSEPASIVIAIDKVAPTILDITKDITTWTNRNVTVTGTAKDELSGVAGYFYSPTTTGSYINVEAAPLIEAEHVFEQNADPYYFGVIDRAGNTAIYRFKVDNIDKINPNLAITRDRTENIITLNITVSDRESGVNEVTVNGQKVPLTPRGNEFTGTYQVTDGGTYTTVVTDVAGNSTSNSFTVYAVRYSGNGVAGSMTSQLKYAGESVTIKASEFSSEDYTFQRWNTEADGSGTNYNPGATYTNDESITLYAQWNVFRYLLDRVVLDKYEYQYTGEAITPIEKVYNNKGKLLQRDIDYTISYYNNIEVGTAGILISGMGTRYGGQTLTTQFAITGIDIAKADMVLDPVLFVYDGYAKRPKETITYGTETLLLGKDYKLQYRNNINAGDAKVIAKGCGRFYGTLEGPFTIVKADRKINAYDIGILKGERLTLDFDYQGDRAADTLISNDARIASIERSDTKYTLVANATGHTTLKYSVPESANYNSAEKTVQVTIFENKEEATPVYGSIVINNGDEYTNTPRTTLSIRAFCAEYMYLDTVNRRPNADSINWVDYSTKMPYEFSAEEGTKTIYVWFKDIKGNVSEVASDDIILNYGYVYPANDSVLLDKTEIDTAQPTVNLTELKPSGITAEIIFRQQDVMRSGTRSGVDNNTIRYGYRLKESAPDAYTWSDNNRFEGLEYSENYVLVTEAYDRAGNGPTRSDEFEFVTPAKYDTLITLTDTRVQCDGLIHEIDMAKFEIYGENQPTGTITYIYYTDRECTKKTTPENDGSIYEGGAPSKAKTYYVKVTLTNDPNYHNAVSNIGRLIIGWYISDDNSENIFAYVEETSTGSGKYELNVTGKGAMADLSKLKARNSDESLVYWKDFKEEISVLTLGDDTSNITSIGKEIFSGLTGISDISLPSTIVIIGDYAFRGDYGVTNDIIIPGLTHEIGINPFADVSTQRFDVSYGNTRYDAVDGVLVTGDHKDLIAYPAGNTAKEYSVVNEIENIKVSAFEGADNLEDVIIPNGVKKIEPKAFYDCDNLGRVQIFDLSENDDNTVNLVDVGEDAFAKIKDKSEIYTFSKKIADKIEEDRDYDSSLTTVYWPPVITLQPVDMNGAIGETVKFIVSADSGFVDEINYEWRKQEGSVQDHLNDPVAGTGSGVRTNEYTTSSLTTANDGDTYYCVVWNMPYYRERGYAYSNAAKITILANANYCVERQIPEYNTENRYYFERLQEAFDFAKSEDNIRVMQNVDNEPDASLDGEKLITFTNNAFTVNMSGTIRVAHGSEIEFNGAGVIAKENGYILESSGHLILDNSALQIKNTGGRGIKLSDKGVLDFDAGLIETTGDAIDASNATINMNSSNAKIVVNSTASAIGISISAYTKLNMAGGSIDVTSTAGEGFDVIGIYNEARDDVNAGKGKVTITGGTINVTGVGTSNGDAIVNDGSADLVVSDAVIVGSRSGIENRRNNKYGDVEVISGSINGGVYGILNNSEGAKIKLGKQDQSVTDDAPIITGNKIAVMNTVRADILEFFDGTLITKTTDGNSNIVYESMNNPDLTIDPSVTEMIYTETGRTEITTEDGYSIYSRLEGGNNVANLRSNLLPVPSQVKGQTVEEGEEAPFEVEIVNPGHPDRYEFEWEVSIDNGVTWNKCTSGVGINGPSYTTSPATKGMDGNLYRCKITSRAGTTYTNSAKLTVLDESLYKDQKPYVRVIYKDETKLIHYDNPNDMNSPKYVDMQVIIKAFSELESIELTFSGLTEQILGINNLAKNDETGSLLYSLRQEDFIKVERGPDAFEYTYTYSIKAYSNGIITVKAVDEHKRENSDSQTVDAIFDLRIGYEKSKLSDSNDRLVITLFANKQVRPYSSSVAGVDEDTYTKLQSIDGTIYSYRYTYRPEEEMPETRFVFEDEYKNQGYVVVPAITRIEYRDIRFTADGSNTITDLNVTDAYEVAQDLEIETETNANYDIQSRYGISSVQADMFMARARDVGAADILSRATSSMSFDGYYIKETDPSLPISNGYGIEGDLRNNYVSAVYGNTNELSDEKANYVDRIISPHLYKGADLSTFNSDPAKPYMYFNIDNKAVNIDDQIYDASFRAVIVGN